MTKCKQCGEYFEADGKFDYFCIKCHKKAKANSVSLNEANKRIISACGEAHQGGQDLILCNLICLVTDFKARHYNEEQMIEELDKFIERFK